MRFVPTEVWPRDISENPGVALMRVSVVHSMMREGCANATCETTVVHGASSWRTHVS